MLEPPNALRMGIAQRHKNAHPTLVSVQSWIRERRRRRGFVCRLRNRLRRNEIRGLHRPGFGVAIADRQRQIMDISIAMTFRTGNGSCGGWSYSVWVLCNT